MKNFLKSYLGLLTAAALASGSLFAFNISTSIDNALQVIKTIRVTSDGTTNNPPFVTMDGSGKYVSIGTTGTDAVFNLSGTFGMAYNDSYGYNALLGYNDPFFNGALGFLYGGLNTSTMVGIFPGSYGTGKIGVMINNDSPNTASSVAVEPGAASITRSIDTANTVVNQVTVNDSGVIVTVSGNQSFWFTKDQRFGSTNTPQNTVDISQTAIPGTLGLRLGVGASNSGQILGLNNNGDVVMVGNIGGFGGGGGPQYWSQSGNALFPTTLSNKIGIGVTNPSQTVQISGTFLSTSINPYGVTAGLLLDNSGLLGQPFAGAYAITGQSLLVAGIDTANQSAALINISGTGNTARIMQAKTTEIQSTYCRTAGCNNISDRNGLQIDANGTTILGYSAGSGAYNTKWQNSGTELMRITNSGNVGIATDSPSTTLNVSGSFLAQTNEASISLSPGLYSGLTFYPLPTASLIVSDPTATGLNASTGITAQVSVYDTRSVNLFDPQVGIAIITTSPDPFNYTQRASIGSKNAEELSFDVESGSLHTSMDIESNNLKIFGLSGSFADMYFDSVLGLFGFGTNTPRNTLDIGGSYIPGTLGLRFSSWPNNSGQILGLNNSGDVITLGNISGFGGGGGPQYWSQSSNTLYPASLSNNVSIGKNAASETFDVSGTMLTTFMNQYGTFGFAGNNTIFGGYPGAGGYATSGGEFLYAGVDHDGNKLSAELVYSSGAESQFISVSQDGPAMLWQSTFPSLYRNSIDITSTGTQSTIMDPLLIGPGAFTWGIDGGVELMRLSNAGYFGIGVTNPLYTLDVGGMVRIGSIPTVSTTTNVLVESGGVISEISPSLLGAGMKTATLTLGSAELANIGPGYNIVCPSDLVNGYIELINATLEYDYNGIAYAGNAASIFTFSSETTTTNLTYSNMGMLGSADRIWNINGGFESAVLTKGACLRFGGSTNLTGGNGTLRVKALYREDVFGQ